jgi:nucleoside-diphosphate-sugar epimerase
MTIEKFLHMYEVSFGLNYTIFRVSNAYGPQQNLQKGQGVLSLWLNQILVNKHIEVWGDGSPIRDFVHAKDVARGMIFAVENKITEPLNMGSGTGVSIKELAKIVAKHFAKPIQWSPEKPSGDAKRIFSMDRAYSYGFQNEVSLEEGVKDAIEWFIANKDIVDKRFNILNK